MSNRYRKRALALSLTAALAISGAAVGGNDHVAEIAPDDTWISVAGTVKAVAPDAFQLDYGDGWITVEMDEWDDDADGYKLVPGDEVTVRGVVDDDLFEARSIEASTVYVVGLNTYFHANPVDEEDYFVAYAAYTFPGDLQIQGTVTQQTGDEFSINTGLQTIDVDVSELGYDPLDDEGFQQIDVGDRVSVSGTIEDGFFLDRDFIAKSVVTLSNRES